jgi:AraC family transcriptional regulator
MKAASRLLASGPGWRVHDFVCTAGPQDRPFEEHHDCVCIAAVTEGTFQYRSSQGAAVLGPGALLLGNEGTCFECGHEHGSGDRCLSFHFGSDLFESIVAAVQGARRTAFALPRLPPSPRLMPLLASLEAARDEGDSAELEELALRVAGAAAAALADTYEAVDRPSRRDERRVTDALRRIEAESDEPLALATLAREAGMSPYHFLRVFKRVVGLTPHQFVLRTRLHRAAVRLRRSDEPISAISFDAGFNDLSTFNRRFRQIMGVTPTLYRAQRRGDRD